MKLNIYVYGHLKYQFTNTFNPSNNKATLNLTGYNELLSNESIKSIDRLSYAKDFLIKIDHKNARQQLSIR